MKHAPFGLTMAAIALATLGAHADAPQITNLLTSHSFEDDTDLELTNAGEAADGVVERSTAQKFAGENSLHMLYDGRDGAGGDFFARWNGYQTGFDAAGPHGGYITTFQLYPLWGTQHWRGSETSDGPNHIGIQIFAVDGGSAATVTDIVVGLMDSENEGFAALGVMDDTWTIPESRTQRVADVPLEQWTKITVYRKPSTFDVEDAIELWVGNTLAGTFNDRLGNTTVGHMGFLGNPFSVSGSGEYYIDDFQFGTGIAGTACNPGDADGDGDVDDDDLSLLLANWGADTDCAHGEFSDIAPVDDDDLSLLLANWTGPLAAAVPEPASLALLLVAASALRRRRR